MPPDDDPEYHQNLQLVRERVRGFLLSRRQAPQDADDLAQDCVLALLSAYPLVRDRIEMLKLATRIASNRMCQLYRDRSRLHTLTDLRAVDDPEQAAGRQELVDRILLGMMELQTRCRDLLRMLLVEQREYPEVSTALGIDSNYIYVLRQRCLQALKRNIGGTFYAR